jgi:hypothetical protein
MFASYAGNSSIQVEYMVVWSVVTMQQKVQSITENGIESPRLSGMILTHMLQSDRIEG